MYGLRPYNVIARAPDPPTINRVPVGAVGAGHGRDPLNGDGVVVVHTDAILCSWVVYFPYSKDTGANLCSRVLVVSYTKYNVDVVVLHHQ